MSNNIFKPPQDYLSDSMKTHLVIAALLLIAGCVIDTPPIEGNETTNTTSPPAACAETCPDSQPQNNDCKCTPQNTFTATNTQRFDFEDLAMYADPGELSLSDNDMTVFEASETFEKDGTTYVKEDRNLYRLNLTAGSHRLIYAEPPSTQEERTLLSHTPKITADGKLVYVRCNHLKEGTTPEAGVCILNLEGEILGFHSTARHFTAPNWNPEELSASRDGSRIAFLGRAKEDAEDSVFLLEEGNITRLTSGASYLKARITGDGNKIAYIKQYDDDTVEAGVLDIGTGRETPLKEYPRLPFAILHITMDHSGETAVIDDDTDAIQVADTATKSISKAAKDVITEYPTISADGESIFFSNIHNYLPGEDGVSNIFLVRPDGTDYSQLTPTTESRADGEKKIVYPKTLPATNTDGSKILYFVFPWEKTQGSSMGKTADCYMEYATITNQPFLI